MKIQLKNGLPFVTILLEYQHQQLILEDVLLDTGSGGTIFSADKVLTIGLEYAPEDTVHRIRGVGGAEFVFIKQIDSLSIGELRVNNFEVEIGAMDYGFAIDGIVGIDFLMQVRAIIDLEIFEIYQKDNPL